MIDKIDMTSTRILLVTHDPNEIVDSITNVLELEKGKIAITLRMRSYS